MGMNSPHDWTIEAFDKDRTPSQAQLEATVDLFQRTIPVFDDINIQENPAMVLKRGDPDALRRLLETRTLLLACDTRENVAGLLEWDARDRETVMIAFISWLMVDPRMQGQGISTLLHKDFEQQRVPQLAETTDISILQGLGVHMKNPATGIYRKWGYSESGFPQYNDGRMLFMAKDAPYAPTKE